ncbi:MAG: tetratricopeptide repeat protein [Proteobacteria bacterium]|jgi:tetratricopeptide (TPR) repeat protein|nr:tetratricopeptide repeat protein [Pseudomonadota bacterium]
MRPGTRAVVLFASLLGAGPSACGAHREVTRLDPVHVTAARDGERVTVDAYDARELFVRASAALRAESYEEATRLYAALLAEFPESELVAPALYNQGLCYDALGRFRDAATSYGALVERFPGSEDAADALFRLAGSYEALEAWDDAVGALDLLVARQELSGIERVEALARRGSALIQVGRAGDARISLEEAVRLYRQGRGVSPSDSVFHYSMAQFKLGEIVHNEMRAIELPEDEALLEARLEAKAKLLLEAQRLYTKVIRIGHPHWAAAAAYRIGALYHHLWKDILDAPPPPGLDAEAQGIYFDILHERTRVLLKKAVVQWERTLKLARRLGLDNEWIDSTTRDLAEIRRELEIEESAAEKDDDPEEPDAGV